MQDIDATAAFSHSLRTLKHNAATRTVTLDAALAALAAQELRDLEPDAPLLEALLTLLPVAWAEFTHDDLCRLHALLVGLLQLPEVVGAARLAAPYITAELINAALERAGRPPDESEVPAPPPRSGAGSQSRKAQGGGQQQPSVAKGAAGAADVVIVGAKGQSTSAGDGTPGSAQMVELRAIRALLHWAYRGGDARVRTSLRSALGGGLLTMAATPLPPPGMRMLLEVLAAIIHGFGAARPSHKALLRDVLVPLHRPSARIDEMTPVLSLYHEALVHCMVALLVKQPSLLLISRMPDAPPPTLRNSQPVAPPSLPTSASASIADRHNRSPQLAGPSH